MGQSSSLRVGQLEFPTRPEIVVHRLAALILVALVACHNAPRGGVDQPGAPTPQLAVQHFLSAAKAQDLQALAAAWGTDKGPAREVVDKSQIEKRELIMMCYLNHDTYRVRNEGPGQEGRRTFTVELNRGGLARTTTMTTVQGPAQRYYVEQVALEPLTDLCAGGVPTSTPPGRTPIRP
jgi:hypothetical protein